MPAIEITTLSGKIMEFHPAFIIAGFFLLIDEPRFAGACLVMSAFWMK
jgi:hypothetical protein